MTIALKPHLGVLEQHFRLAKEAGEFVSLVRVLLQAKGDLWLARQIGEQRRVSRRVLDLLNSNDAIQIIRRGRGPQWNPRGDRGNAGDQWLSQKAAVSALSLVDNSAFAVYETLVSGFVNALSSTGIFDQMRTSARQVPVGRTAGAVSVAAVGFTVNEGQAKPVSRLSLTSGALEPQKSHALVAVSNELLKHGGREVEALITRELINACVLAVDAAFLAILLSGVSVGTSVGQTATAVRNDLASLFAQVTTDATSKLFIITTPAVCKSWCAMGATASNGTPAFPDMTPQGGSILGVPVIASDAVTAGQVILCDATGIAAGSDTIVLNSMSEGTIMPDTAPDSPQVAGTNVVSLWQSDLSAILAERWWGAERLRANCVAAVSNSNSYQQGFSPP